MKSIHIKVFVAVFLIIGVSCCVIAQDDPPLRIEIETRSDEATYEILPCNNSGLLFFYETTQSGDDTKIWIFIFHNKYLTETWKIEVPVLKDLTYVQHYLDDDQVYVLFYDPDRKKTAEFNLQCLVFNISSGDQITYSAKLNDKSDIIDCELFNGRLFLAANMRDGKAAVFSMDTETGSLNEIFLMDEGTIEIEQIKFDTNKNSLFVLVNQFISKSNHLIKILEIEGDGKILNTFTILAGNNKKINTVRIVSINDKERLILGTYYVTKGKSIDVRNYFENEASGFYSAKLTDSNVSPVSYYNFLDFDNLTGYLRAKDVIDAKKKAKKQKKKDNKYYLSYDMLIHDVIENNGSYYFLAEAFYEEYHTVTSMYYDYYGRPMPLSYSVFDGYQYFNAFLCSFNQEGEKLWDNGMEIFNILTFDLKNRINMFFSSKDIITAYNCDGKIASKIIAGNEVVEGVEYYPIETLYQEDKIMSDTKSSMTHWYDNYFLCYGYQTIKNNAVIDKNKRLVFYINKVAFW